MAEQLSPEAREALRLGEALYAIRDTAGWRAVKEYLRKTQYEAALRGIEDAKLPVEFSRGYVAALRDAAEYVDRAIDQAAQVKEAIEESGDTAIGVRIGRSDGGSLVGEEL